MGRIFSALVVIVTVLIAKVPNPHCHCFDKNKSQKQECPFGKLRAAVAALTITSDFAVAEVALTAYEDSKEDFSPRYSFQFVVQGKARDSPIVITS